MIVVAIVGVLSAVAIPAFMKYLAKSKTAEAREMVKKIYDGARAYWLDPPNTGDIQSFQPVAAQFPVINQGGPGDTGYLAQNCCAAPPGTNEKCEPNAAFWEADVWVALRFGITEPHYYAYRYVHSQPVAADLTGQNHFFALAQGDLDCDAVRSNFQMYGVVDGTYADGPSGTALLQRMNELE
jgi:type II secretory pathway pseudopilin PulG